MSYKSWAKNLAIVPLLVALKTGKTKFFQLFLGYAVTLFCETIPLVVTNKAFSNVATMLIYSRSTPRPERDYVQQAYRARVLHHERFEL